MEKTNIWSRMGKWFRRSGRASAFDGGEAAHVSPVIAEEAVGASSPSTTEGASAGSGVGEGSSLGRLKLSRTAALERLEEEYQRVVELMDKIRAHMSAQEERTEAIVRAVAVLNERLAELPEWGRRQEEALRRVAEASESQQGSMKRLEGELMQLPQLADALRETLVSVDRNLTDSTETARRVAVTVDELGSAVTRLSDTSETSAKKIEQFRWDLNARDDRMTMLLERQTQRLTWFALAAVGLGAVGVGIGVAALLR